MSHNCTSILFHCMDFRLTAAIRDWMAREGNLGDSDVVSLAGSAKELVDGNDEVKAHLLKQIDISAKLHHASRVILLHHTQCGAYAQSYTFASEDEEIAKHTEDLTKAAEMINMKFPDITVMKVIAVMKDGEGKEVEFRTIA